MSKTFENHPVAEIAVRFINQTDRHVFLTGKAGTGKTTFLKRITDLSHKSTVVAAPTGIAAINAKGVTLHSLFQLPFGSFIPSDSLPEGHIDVEVNTPKTLMESFRMNTAKRNMLRELELLIIDEVSMLRADLLDAIDVVLRSVRGQSNLPFGGVQILFIGDLLQLPPVAKAEQLHILAPWYPSLFFFNARALACNPPLYVELDKIFRQSDPEFISLLNHLRENRLTREDIDLLNRHYDPSFRPEAQDGYIFLTTHNKKADMINRRSLDKLPGKNHFFEAEVEGDFGPHLYPVECRLELKTGAQVMFVKNDYSGENRYFNGKIGTVTRLRKDKIFVSFSDGNPATSVDPYVWENKQYFLDKETNEVRETIIGAFSQYPLKLAWAITVHKSQGLTFEKAVIDVSKAFAPGQIYVALSRPTSLDGLVLSAPIPARNIDQDRSLYEFADNKKDLSQLHVELEDRTLQYIRDITLKAYDFSPLMGHLTDHVNSYDKDEKTSVKQKYKDWARAVLQDTMPLKDVADKFVVQLKRITAPSTKNDLSYLHQRLLAAKVYFDPFLYQFSYGVRIRLDFLEY